MTIQTRSGTAIALLAVACLTIMVGCVIVPGLPSIAKQLGVAHAASWLVTIPSLGVVIFGPLAGRWIEKAGLYKALCHGLVLYGLLGVGGALLRGYWLVFADRLLLGGATALVMASGTGLISLFYEGKARMAMMAKQGMAIELGGVIMLALGGVLASIHWFWPFALYLTAWLLFALVLWLVPNPQVAAPSHGETADTPKLPAAIKLVYFAALLSMVVFFTAVIVLPFRLHAQGFSEAQTGYFLSFVSLMAVAAAANMPKVVTQLGEHKTLLLAFICYALGHGCFAFAQQLSVFIAGAVLTGIGFGLSIPLVNHMTVELSHPKVRGRFLAYLSMAIFSGQFLSSFVAMVPVAPATTFEIATAVALVAGILVMFFHQRIRHVTD
ncbi:MFS transporter [Gallaecimonas mangrovi]|uniref:MFS transporter n=1 Tax=Gallaecimonas mangrovi TaxID=2291597 RepID=UPI000E2053D0|nr:MFS transporter [Gallaecimonas mangrovi]